MQDKYATEAEARAFCVTASREEPDNRFIIIASAERKCPTHGKDAHPGSRDFCCPELVHETVFYVEDDAEANMTRNWEREVAHYADGLEVDGNGDPLEIQSDPEADMNEILPPDLR